MPFDYNNQHKRGMLRPQNSGSRIGVYICIAAGLVFLAGIYNYHGLSARRQEIAEQLKETETKLDVSQKEISDLQGQLRSIKSASDQLNTQLKSNNDQLQSVQEEKVNQEKLYQGLKEQMDKMQSKDSDTAESIKQLNTQVDTCNANVAELTKALDECRKKPEPDAPKLSENKPVVNENEQNKPVGVEKNVVNLDSAHENLGNEVKEPVNDEKLGKPLDEEKKIENENANEKKGLESVDQIDVPDNKNVGEVDSVPHRGAPVDGSEQNLDQNNEAMPNASKDFP